MRPPPARTALKRGTIAAVLVAAFFGLAGCGGKSGDENRVPGTTLTIYSSVPLHGASSVSAKAVVSGAELALAQTRGRIGRYHIVLRELDDSNPQRGGWDPGQTTLDAHQAVQDKTTIGYIGEFNSGASAVSIPLLNRAGIPQISPASTAVGLTSAGPGAAPGEPDKYYPTGVRTFARVVPNDSVQARAQVQLLRSMGCQKTYVLDDGEVDGQDTATSFQLAAKGAGLPVLGVQSFNPKATDYSALATAVAQTGADCVLLSAITEDNAVLLTKQIASAMPGAQILGSAGLAESTYTDPADGGIPTSLDPRVMITVAALGPDPSSPAARAFYAAYRQRFGPAQPYAIYGYEAMSLMLDAIDRATDHGSGPARRSKVVAAIFDTRNRHSVLGTYSIDSRGDTTLRRYGALRVLDGQLRLWKVLDV
ncbi:MAG: branched-chain amino acid ABC transporter substrate-binding protein [Solirubrobacterales bacterium]|nr:branched-chain amino acid ABC transporter substrate-binding protein [Solirubrobacterales bacterium]